MAVRVKSKSKVDLNKIRDGIMMFINSDPLLQQKNHLRLRQNQELLTRLYIDIAELDSLQKVKYFEETRNRQPQKGAQLIFMQQQTTQLVYSDIYSLYARRQSLETERDLYDSIVTIISDFTLPEIMNKQGFLYGKSIVLSLFFGTLMVLVLLANRKKLIEIYNKY